MFETIVLEFHASEASRKMIAKLLWVIRDKFLEWYLSQTFSEILGKIIYIFSSRRQIINFQNICFKTEPLAILTPRNENGPVLIKRRHKICVYQRFDIANVDDRATSVSSGKSKKIRMHRLSTLF